MSNLRSWVATISIALLLAPQSATAQQQAVSVPFSVLEKYLGEYVYPDGETIKVTLHGNTLFREVPAQQVPYIPLSETLFRLGPVFTAEFVLDDKGGITQVLTDGTVEYRLRRKGSPMAAPPMPAEVVRVPRSALERYVGVYEYIPGQMKRTDLRVTMRLKGDTLIREIGEGPQTLTPMSETQFVVAGTSIKVEFIVDAFGVTQVMGTRFQQMLARLTPKR